MKPYFLLRRATSLAQAVAQAKGLCRCKRLSFVGVRWVEGGQEYRLKWAEIDGA